MDYFGMLASFRSTLRKKEKSEGFVCLFPRTELRGIGDESNDAYMVKAVKVCSHKGRRDEHSSFPKGLLPVENIKE